MDYIESQIIGFLTLNPGGLTASELQSQIHPKVSQPTLWRRLNNLRATGQLQKTGRGRASRYLKLGSNHSVQDLRSKVLHIEVGRKLIRQPELLNGARHRLQRMYGTIPYSKVYLDRWDNLLSGPLEEILKVLGTEDEESKALRHVSPFAGVLSDEERLAVLRKNGLAH